VNQQPLSAQSSFDTIVTHESDVRVYSRHFPAVFNKARGSVIWDESGRRFIDFFAGAGALNYGHNPPEMKSRLIDYLREDGITHGLDMATLAKARLLHEFQAVILKPRGLDYKVAFPGPTGANAVECAMKIARKATGRPAIISFTNAFHGMTLGSLALTGNADKRAAAGTLLTGVERMPFDGYLGPNIDTLDYFERALEDPGSGIDVPAAVIVETVQAEGGINVASDAWLQRLQSLCRRHAMLLIVDDIQVGCGRTGPFFSFEPAGIVPDIICLSKSLSGYGLPLALTLVAPQFDCLKPGEHNGTFRGNNLSFVTAVETLRFWQSDGFSQNITAKGCMVREALETVIARHPELDAQVRGRGLIQGLVVRPADLAQHIAQAAFTRGLIVETVGAQGEVVKIMPPLVIENNVLCRGLEILAEAVCAALQQSHLRSHLNDRARRLAGRARWSA
jgi:diaminobutyrate-2-oxoglutarate transaminase